METRTLNRWLLGIALVVAAFLRLVQLDTLPNGLYHDEAYNGLDALALLEGQTFPIFHEGWELYPAEAHAERGPREARFPIFFEGNYGREPVHVYLMALSVALFGNTAFAVRLVPAVAGIVGVWTTYLAAQTLFARKNSSTLIPGVAAFAVAILFPAVHFSRFGLRVMLFLPLSTLIIHFFWRGILALQEEGQVRWLDWVIAGVLLGFGPYVYAVGRIFPLLFVAFVPILLWVERAKWKTWLTPVSVMAGVSALTALPILIYYLQYPYFFFFRVAYVANRGRGVVEGQPGLTWLQNIPRVLLGLVWRGETHFRHNLPGRPFMDPIQSGFFAFGWVALIQKRVPLRAIFLVLWLAVTLLPSIMSGDAPHFGRMSGSIPVLAILIGLGADAIWRWGKGYSRAVLAGLLVLAMASAALTQTAYFGAYASHPLMETDFDADLWALGETLTGEGDSDFYLMPTRPQLATVYFALGSDRTRLRNLNPDSSLFPAGRPDQPVVYAFTEEAEPAAGHILTRSGASLVSDEEVYRVYSAEPNSLAPNDQPIHTFGDTIDLMAVETLPTDPGVEVTLLWRAASQPERDYTAFVHLLSAEGEIVSQIDREPPGYPTSDWAAEEWIEASYFVPWPESGKPDSWQIRTGFYFLPTLEPLGQPVEVSE